MRNAFFGRAWSKSKIRIHGSIADYTEVIKLNPNNGDAFYNRGLEKHNSSQYYEAISDYSKAILINKKYSDAFINRSLSKTEIIIKGACTDAVKAKSLGYKSVENEKWIKENCSSSFKFFKLSKAQEEVLIMIKKYFAILSAFVISVV